MIKAKYNLKKISNDVFKQHHCGFYRNRQKVFLFSSLNQAEALAKFKQLKAKYKSAWYQTPFIDLAKNVFNSPNPLFIHLKKTDNFVGKVIEAPISFKKEKLCKSITSAVQKASKPEEK